GVFPGYYDNDQATAAGQAPGGFWRTGDIVEIRQGNIFLKGRLSERIRRFGYTVSPRDVEWALRQNPAIKDVFVLGRQIPRQPNDKLTYFIVGHISESDLRAYCQANLLFAWRPDKVIFLDKLPKTNSGKTHLKALQAILDKPLKVGGGH